ncbi:MAG TPA: glycoside hydrolase family 15 protein [Candidatus Saccharimonadales bacterium]|nr:glycoside hydrolase family 15 protein [Candidatus Saccharimonadales bacterium]
MSEAFLALDQPPLTVEQFASNPSGLREYLEERGTFDFATYQSGLFPASVLPPELEATDMGMVWRRDSSHVINALFEAGRQDLALPAARAQLASMNQERDILDGVVDGSRDPNQPGGRLAVRMHGKTGARDREFRVQNDSVGYPLWVTSRLIEHDALKPTSYDLDTLAQTVRYLGKIKYWQDQDAGHWEEEMAVHAPSIGTVIAGLESAQRAMHHVGYQHDIHFDELIQRGRNVFDAMITHGYASVPSVAEWARQKAGIIPEDLGAVEFLRTFSAHYRRFDAAMLFMVEPLNVASRQQAIQIVADVEQNLVRNRGVIRYPGDTYWEPRFKHIMSIDERTSQAEGRLERRNQMMGGVALSQTEAQWTLFDSPLSTIHGTEYQHSGDQIEHSKQLIFMNRVLAQLVPYKDKLVLPEAFYLDYAPVPCGSPTNQWIPNDHMPLLWAQANLLKSVATFEATGV